VQSENSLVKSRVLDYLSDVKIRSIHNAIRLRLRKSELAQLDAQSTISETIHFPGGTALIHVLMKSKTASRIQVEFIQGKITVSIPESMADEWIHSNEVGIETTIEIEETAPLHILIEKDFPCLDRPNEDKSDTFWELAAEKKPNDC